MRPNVTALFREVADRAPAEREDYYIREQVPEELRAEVESLLQYDAAEDSLRGYVSSAERLLIDSSSSAAGEPLRSSRGAPDTIGRFIVTRLLGRGGMGEVYLARDPLIDRAVAIKLIGGEHEGDVERHRLVREARAAGRLHHPNIVTVFEAGEHHGRSYIAMEYVAGETVGSIIRRRAPLSLRQRLEMIEGACAGLAHAHREGVVHLDIKPDNLMLDAAGIVKVLDFGISRVLQSETLVTMHGAGTLRYMSPEQIQGKTLDQRSDVFSLGCSLFELISYAPAFSGSTKEIVTQIAGGPVPSLLDVSPGVDPRLDDIIARAMAIDAAERYDDLDEMRADVAAVRAGIDPAADLSQAASPLGVASPGRASQSSASASRLRRTTRPPRWRSRWAIVAGSVAAAAALAGVVTFFAWGASPSVDSGSGSAAAVATPGSEAAAPVAPPPAVNAGGEVAGQIARDDRAAVPARKDPAPVRTDATIPPAAAAPVTPVETRTLAQADITAAAPNRVAPPSPPVTDPSQAPAAALPPPASAAPAPVVPAPVVIPGAAPPRSAPSDSEAIADALRRYDAAYKALDVGALLKVFPSLASDQVEQLRRTFAGMTAYEIDTRVTRETVANDTATVFARLTRRMTPRVGKAVANEVDAEFQLRRSGADWQIVSVSAR